MTKKIHFAFARRDHHAFPSAAQAPGMKQPAKRRLLALAMTAAEQETAPQMFVQVGKMQVPFAVLAVMVAGEIEMPDLAVPQIEEPAPAVLDIAQMETEVCQLSVL